MITFDFHAFYIPIGRGVLQGECHSPFLFNCCFNALVPHIMVPDYRQFGFVVDCCKSLDSAHWFQFADDAAVVVSPLELKNQHQDQSNTCPNF